MHIELDGISIMFYNKTLTPVDKISLYVDMFINSWQELLFFFGFKYPRYDLGPNKGKSGPFNTSEIKTT